MTSDLTNNKFLITNSEHFVCFRRHTRVANTRDKTRKMQRKNMFSFKTLMTIMNININFINTSGPVGGQLRTYYL